jgi:hypothetical protein
MGLGPMLMHDYLEPPFGIPKKNIINKQISAMPHSIK